MSGRRGGRGGGAKYCCACVHSHLQVKGSAHTGVQSCACVSHWGWGREGWRHLRGGSAAVCDSLSLCCSGRVWRPPHLRPGCRVVQFLDARPVPRHCGRHSIDTPSTGGGERSRGDRGCHGIACRQHEDCTLRHMKRRCTITQRASHLQLIPVHGSPVSALLVVPLGTTTSF